MSATIPILPPPVHAHLTHQQTQQPSSNARTRPMGNSNSNSTMIASSAAAAALQKKFAKAVISGNETAVAQCLAAAAAADEKDAASKAASAAGGKVAAAAGEHGSSAVTTLLSGDVIPDTPGCTAVKHAADKGRSSLVMLLLAAEPVMGHADRQHSQYLDSLVRRAPGISNPDLRQLVMQYAGDAQDVWVWAAAAAKAGTGSGPVALFAAARMGDAQEVQRLLAAHEGAAASEAADVRLEHSAQPGWVGSWQWQNMPKSALEAALKHEWVARATPGDSGGGNGSGGGGSSAAAPEQQTAVQLLVAAALHEQLTGLYGFEALLAATRAVDGVKAVRLLLDAGAPVVWGTTAYNTRAVLPRAAAGSMDIFTAVLAAAVQRGGDLLNKSDCALGTALHTAVRRQRMDVVNMLLQRGADVNARDSAGCSVLSGAVSNRDMPMLQRLLAAGADASLKSACDVPTTPLSQAAEGLHSALVDALLQHSKAALPVAALIEAAWAAAGAVKSMDFEDEEDYLEAMEQEAMGPAEPEPMGPADVSKQHSIMRSLLEAAVASDPAAAAAALADCSKQLDELHREAKYVFDTAAGCSCGCCPQPDPVDPSGILRASVMLKVLSAVWLEHPVAAADLSAQQTAVQHLLVATASSIKQQQEAQRTLPERQKQLAAREKQLARREKQLAAKEQQLAKQQQQVTKQQQAAKRPAPAAAGDDGAGGGDGGPATRSKRARTAAGGSK